MYLTVSLGLLFFIQQQRCPVWCVFTSWYASFHYTVNPLKYTCIHVYVYLFCIFHECCLLSDRKYDRYPFGIVLFFILWHAASGLSLASIFGIELCFYNLIKLVLCSFRLPWSPVPPPSSVPLSRIPQESAFLHGAGSFPRTRCICPHFNLNKLHLLL